MTKETIIRDNLLMITDTIYIDEHIFYDMFFAQIQLSALFKTFNHY